MYFKYTGNDNPLKDTDNPFESFNWDVSENEGNSFLSMCAGNKLFGGPGKFGSKTRVIRHFVGLPPHTAVRISGYYHLLDCI